MIDLTVIWAFAYAAYAFIGPGVDASIAYEAEIKVAAEAAEALLTELAADCDQVVAAAAMIGGGILLEESGDFRRADVSRSLNKIDVKIQIGGM